MVTAMETAMATTTVSALKAIVSTTTMKMTI